jgi:hypothetical protein
MSVVNYGGVIGLNNSRFSLGNARFSVGSVFNCDVRGELRRYDWFKQRSF